MEQIKVTWDQTETLSAVIPLPDAIELYNQSLKGGLDSVKENYKPLASDATAAEVLAALRENNDLANQLAAYDSNETVREDGPYRDAIELEQVNG